RFINYNTATRTYTELTGAARSSANAIMITCQRSVELPFTKLLGMNACTVRATARAMWRPDRYAAVGINWINMTGNSTDSYTSTGPAGSSWLGSIASNGDITLA